MFENLKVGSTGDNVKILQEKLKILGFYNATITGSFGVSLEEGVKAFQKEYNLDVTGVVDEDVWNLINSLTDVATPISLFPTLRLGSTGSDVSDLQSKLSALLYYTGSISSNFDLETENAVKRFQMNNNLTADGIVGSSTWNKLNSLYGNLADCVVDSESNYLTYTVQKGDSLYSIAKKYNTTVDKIKNLNNLTSDIINIGKVLKIPEESTDTGNDNDYQTYTVQSGDTLYKIAQRFNTTVNDIKSLNNLTSDIINVGQILKIPEANIAENYITYTVVKGDTLYLIAKNYNTTVDAIKNLNNLTSNTINIGQTLKIPTTNENYFNYVVVRGDTLYSIARKYNTTVNEIKKLNNLTNNTINLGQVLRIPL